jgi:ATP-dependent DNA helicase RecQ
MDQMTKQDAAEHVLQQYWGYGSFRPLQREAIDCVLNHRDSVVVLPTGGGKSLCFQVPALCQNRLAVVVSPLISLMKDQVDGLQACGVAAACVNSTQSPDERRSIANQLRAGKLCLLYVSPERLMSERMLAFLQEIDVCFFAIDEAHCISSWGHDFRPEFRGLRVLKELFPQCSVHAYTATASEQVRLDIAEQLQLRDPTFLVGSFDRPNLTYRVRPKAKIQSQIEDVIEQHPDEAGIVYCISRAEVERTAVKLQEAGIRALPYHAGLDDQTRRRNQEAFIGDRAQVIVATVAFGMGIDKPNVRFVIHAGMPKSLESYQQESGRAGRDGLESDCWLFYSAGDYLTWKGMTNHEDAAAQEGALASLQAISDFCGSVTCRHQALVRYFGQELEQENCGACDVCLNELDMMEDPLRIAQMILSCVVRLRERFGADYTAQVLGASKDQRILQQGHHQLSTYGLLEAFDRRQIRDWIEQLVAQRFLEKTGEYNTLEVTPAGRELLRGNAVPRLLRPAARGKRRPTRMAESLENVDQALFESLRRLRREQAEQRNVPAYIIFGDAALREMARRAPRTLEDFREVRGVGDKKCQDFGELFVHHIREHVGRGGGTGTKSGNFVESKEPIA